MNKLNKILCAAALASVGTVANADPIVISDWSFINEAGFSDWNPNSIVGSGDSAGGGTSILSTGSLNTELCWGTGVGINGQSCLGINSPVTEGTTESWDENGVMQDLNGGAAQGNAQTVDFNQDYVPYLMQGTALRHDNYPITGTTLDNVTITDGLQLGFSVEGGDTILAPELEFLVDFWETPNGQAGASCPYGPVSRTPNSINENGCADVFSVVGFDQSQVLAFGADYIDFAVNIHLGGLVSNAYHKTYQVITRLSGLELIIPNNGVPTFGFLTKENGVNVLNAQFAVRAIPEPSTLAIFGLSLLGLVGLGRRKANK